MRQQTIPDYLRNKYQQEQTPFRVTPSGQFYLVNGQRVDKKEYEASLPLGSKIGPYYPKGDNPDSTYID